MVFLFTILWRGAERSISSFLSRERSTLWRSEQQRRTQPHLLYVDVKSTARCTSLSLSPAPFGLRTL